MLSTRNREGAPIEILDFRSGELEAREIMPEIVRDMGKASLGTRSPFCIAATR